MSVEAESNSELTVIVPAYQLLFRFPVQNKIYKQKILSDTRTGRLGSIASPCNVLPARSDGLTNFKKSVWSSLCVVLHLMYIKMFFCKTSGLNGNKLCRNITVVNLVKKNSYHGYWAQKCN